MNGKGYFDIKEWKVVYSPKNDVFKQLLMPCIEKIVQSEPIGIESVGSPEEVEEIMIQRRLIAGIVFEHSAVNYMPSS